jgi:hypothetical protein
MERFNTGTFWDGNEMNVEGKEASGLRTAAREILLYSPNSSHQCRVKPRKRLEKIGLVHLGVPVYGEMETN